MTDDTTSKIDIDRALLRDYIKQYRETDDREEQRRIENQVLQETVWQSSFQHFQEQPSLSKKEFQQVYKELPDDAKHARMILRSLRFRSL
jgi:hypothetical protein